MTSFLLICFVGIGVAMLLWGIAKHDRIFQYPFIMGSIFLSFLFPQAIALVNNPGLAQPQAVNRILFYTILCLTMCWVGYVVRPNEKWITQNNDVVHPQKLTQVAWGLIFFGNTCSWLLSRITIQIDAATSNWTGPATILLFFADTSLIGGAILLILVLSYRYKSRLNLAGVGFAFYPTLAAVLSAGRRQSAATLLIIVSLGLFFSRRILPPRWLVLTLVSLTTFLIPLLAQMREDFWMSLFSGNLSVDDLQFALDRLLEGDILELRNAALVAEGVEQTGQYGFGTGFWNSIVFQYVPGQLLGYGFKNSLYINISNYDLRSLFGYDAPPGSTTTGIGDSFQEFSYLGCFIFAWIAYFFKNLWISAVYYRSIYSQVLYIGLISPALVGLTHGVGRFIQEAIFQVVIVSLAIGYSRIRLFDNKINSLSSNK